MSLVKCTYQYLLHVFQELQILFSLYFVLVELWLILIGISWMIYSTEKQPNAIVLHKLDQQWTNNNWIYSVLTTVGSDGSRELLQVNPQWNSNHWIYSVLTTIGADGSRVFLQVNPQWSSNNWIYSVLTTIGSDGSRVLLQVNPQWSSNNWIYSVLTTIGYDGSRELLQVSPRWNSNHWIYSSPTIIRSDFIIDILAIELIKKWIVMHFFKTAIDTQIWWSTNKVSVDTHKLKRRFPQILLKFTLCNMIFGKANSFDLNFCLKYFISLVLFRKLVWRYKMEPICSVLISLHVNLSVLYSPFNWNLD